MDKVKIPWSKVGIQCVWCCCRDSKRTHLFLPVFNCQKWISVDCWECNNTNMSSYTREWGGERERRMGRGESAGREGRKESGRRGEMYLIHSLVGACPWPHPFSHSLLTSHINTSAQTDHYTTHHAHAYVPHQYILPDNSWHPLRCVTLIHSPDAHSYVISMYPHR